MGEHLIVYLDGRLLKANVTDYPNWQGTPLTYGQAGITAEGMRAIFTKIGVLSYDPAGMSQ